MYLSQTNELWKFLENDGEKNANRGNDQIHLTGKKLPFHSSTDIVHYHMWE